MKVNGHKVFQKPCNHKWLYKVARHIKEDHSWTWGTTRDVGAGKYLHFVNHGGDTVLKWWTI